MLFPQINLCRSLIDLSGFCEFKPDPDNLGEKQRWYRGVKASHYCSFPASWNDLYPDLEIKNRIETVWYFIKTMVPQDWQDKLVWLRIGSANYRAKVWVNGKYVGKHEGGYMPFQFNIDSSISFQQENPHACQILSGKPAFHLATIACPAL